MRIEKICRARGGTSLWCSSESSDHDVLAKKHWCVIAAAWKVGSGKRLVACLLKTDFLQYEE